MEGKLSNAEKDSGRAVRLSSVFVRPLWRTGWRDETTLRHRAAKEMCHSTKRTHRERVWGSFWVLPGCWAKNEASFKEVATGFPLTLNLSPGGERRLRRRRASKHAFCETNRIFMSGKIGDKLLRGNLMRDGSEDFSIRFVWSGNVPILNRLDATERVPPSSELESGRADNSLARGGYLGYKAGE
jgi:hypothetical protein